MELTVLNSKFLVFVDDLKLFRKVESEADRVAFQNELNFLSLWFSILGLQFNTSKYNSMSLSRFRVIIDHIYTVTE
ncbi:Uncharacterized protein FWK35_00016589 [Aphis craccivora]|uniref:Reverse transcriptase domain-containing protein n=1 Tax=Aphis craccivora TaxID=307492 RepID=A0A6G0YYK9_APHCR|nr:Uncharacterized protein FWK35_00016589 [Aphis craccivora]